MKQLFIAAALVAFSFSAAHAGNGITQSSNDSAITAGHQALSAKISQLQSNLTAKNYATCQTLANDIITLMGAGMKQGKARRDLESTLTAANAANKKFQAMEMAQYYFRQLSANVATNGTQMISKANAFLNDY